MLARQGANAIDALFIFGPVCVRQRHRQPVAVENTSQSAQRFRRIHVETHWHKHHREQSRVVFDEIIQR